MCLFNMSTRILVICALIVLAGANDIILLNQNLGKQVLDAKYEASPAIWRQVKNVTFQTTNDEIISKIIVTDLRPEKDGVAAVAAGGLGQDNVVIELQSPSLLRGFDYRVQIFTISRNAGRSRISTTTPSILSSFFVPQLVTIGLEANIEQLQKQNVLRSNANQNKTGQTENPDTEKPNGLGGYSPVSDLRLIIDNKDLNIRNNKGTLKEDLNITSPMPTSVRSSEIQKIEDAKVNLGINQNNTSTNTEVQSDESLRTSSITESIEEKNNTTEKSRKTRDTAANSKKDNNTVSTVNVAKKLRTIETTTTSSIHEKTAEKRRNSEPSNDDDEDQYISETVNVRTSKLKSYSRGSQPNNGKDFETTEELRSKRDTSTVTIERQDLTNLRNNKNQYNSKQTEKSQKDGSSTVSPSSLRRIGDPHDKFGETGPTQRDEGLRKENTTQASRTARTSEVNNSDITARQEVDNLNINNKSEHQADYKFLAFSQSSTQNIDTEKEIGTTQVPKSFLSTELKNIAHTDNSPQNDDKDSKPQVHTGVPFRTSLPSTENIVGKKNTTEKLRIGRDTITETKNYDRTGKVNVTLRNIETTSNPINSTSPSHINTTKRLKNANETRHGDARFVFHPPGEGHRRLPTSESDENLRTSPIPRIARDSSYYSSDSYHYLPMHYRSVENVVTTARATILLETELDMPMDYKK